MKFSLDRFKIVVPPGISKLKLAVLLGVSGLSSVLILHGIYKNFFKSPPQQKKNVAAVTTQQQPPKAAPVNTPPMAKQSASSAPKGKNADTKQANANNKLITNNSKSSKAVQNNKDAVGKTSIIDPFIEIPDLPKLEGMGHTLPSIPRPDNIPRPSVGNIPTPPVPAIPGSGHKPLGVQGILINPNGGNMAIMSDGTVITEGETYNDNRITYIGSDGVAFDNGNMLEYSANGFNNK